MGRKKQIEITGKEEGLEPTRLDQILGEFNELSLYGTKSEVEYEQEIKGMNRTELQIHASKVGVIPVDDIENLRKSLIREFRAYSKSLFKPINTNHLPDKIPANIRAILAEQK